MCGRWQEMSVRALKWGRDALDGEDVAAHKERRIHDTQIGSKERVELNRMQQMLVLGVQL